MTDKEIVLETMKKAGEPVNAGKVAEMSGLDRKAVDKAFNELKKEGAIISPVRCKWEPAKKIMVKSADKSEVLKLGNQLCFPLYACAKEVIKIYRKPLEKIGLTYTQYIVMMVLWEYGAMSEKSLGEKIYLDSGTLTPVLKKLEKSGFVKRQRVAEDERFVKIILTDNGLKLKEKALNIPQALKGNIYLSYNEVVALYNLLNKNLKGIKERTKSL